MSKEWRPRDEYTDRVEREKPKFFALVPIHDRFRFFQGTDLDEIKRDVSAIIQVYKKSYPNHDFDSQVIYIKGEKLNQ